MLAKRAGKAVSHWPHQVGNERPLPGFDEDISGHSRRRTKVLDLIAQVMVVKTHSDDERVSPCGLLFASPAGSLIDDRVCRNVYDFAFNHRRQTLIERCEPNERTLSFSDVRYFVGIHPRFNYQLVVDRKQLEDGSTRSNNAAGRVLVEFDHNPAHWRAHFGPLHNVSGSQNLLPQII
jgi:hypothetical protein